MSKLLAMLLLSPFVLFAQRDLLEINGMQLTYQLENDSIEITLSAPTKGWVGIGFNRENNIVGGDLLLFHYVNGKVEAKDLFVKGFGDPRDDKQLGGNKSVVILEGEESSHETTVKFKLALDSQDPYDFKHERGNDFWLIMAYSTHDDFDHHSRMRKHLLYRFE